MWNDELPFCESCDGKRKKPASAMSHAVLSCIVCDGRVSRRRYRVTDTRSCYPRQGEVIRFDESFHGTAIGGRGLSLHQTLNAVLVYTKLREALWQGTGLSFEGAGEEVNYFVCKRLVKGGVNRCNGPWSAFPTLSFLARSYSSGCRIYTTLQVVAIKIL